MERVGGREIEKDMQSVRSRAHQLPPAHPPDSLLALPNPPIGDFLLGRSHGAVVLLSLPVCAVPLPMSSRLSPPILSNDRDADQYRPILSYTAGASARQRSTGPGGDFVCSM